MSNLTISNRSVRTTVRAEFRAPEDVEITTGHFAGRRIEPDTVYADFEVGFLPGKVTVSGNLVGADGELNDKMRATQDFRLRGPGSASQPPAPEWVHDLFAALKVTTR